jgi:glycosyltransferase involved in cell wall biosynthesis
MLEKWWCSRKLRVLAIAAVPWRGGAQEVTLEMFRLLKGHHVDVRVLTGESAERSFLSDLENLGIATDRVPSKMISNYPDLAVEKHAELVESSDVVWITDVEYLVAPRIKRIRRDLPIIAHLHSYALACPIWSAFYGMSETCKENCSSSLRRYARCKLLEKRYRAHWHQRSTRMQVYQLLNFPKSCVDFTTWPMKEFHLESIDGFVAVSRFTRDLMRAHMPQLYHVPVEVVPNPVMVPQPSASPRNYPDSCDRTILYASGSNISKGPHIALCAARKLVDQGFIEFTLTMLGVERNAWIKGIAGRLRIEEHVRLLPRLPSRTEVAALMASSKALLLPSLWPEPFASVPIEANLLGTPAIVSNRGGNPDTIVDKFTGLVAEPSVDAVANSLNDALTRDWNRELIARTAKERFDRESIFDHFIGFLKTFV